MSTSQKLQQKSFIQSILPLAKTQQFYWFLGHVLGLIFFVLNFLTSFYSRTLKYYKLTLVSILITYVIVIRQIYFKVTGLKGLMNIRNREFRLRLLRDENVQYFLLASVFYLSSFKIGSISGGLYSFTIFSIFHVLTYFQNNLLSALPISSSKQQSINASINNFTSNFNQQALLIAANSEIFMISGFLFSIPIMLIKVFRDPIFVMTNFFVFLSVVIFIKLRYDSNQYTQSVLKQWDMKVSQLLLNPYIPPALGHLYNQTFKGFLLKYIEPIKVPKTLKKN